MRVLVTGATGFLGRTVVRHLLERGDNVSTLVRHTGNLPDGTQTIHGDIRRAEVVQKACQNIDAVIHVAATVGDWGSYKDFFSTNVTGTENVIRACHAHSISKLVYCSTPSVVFNGEPIRDGDESLPYAVGYLCSYQKTKAIAEKKVLDANDPNRLTTVALRPHAIWGIGDPHSIPRLLRVARSGKLKIVGDGKNRISMTHVDNAAAAHVQAMDSNKVGGKAYFVNDPEPVFLWDWYAKILGAVGLKLPDSQISFQSAFRLGQLLEWTHSLLPFLGRPKITRYVAAVLAKDHFFNTELARTDFGFQSVVCIEDELKRLQTNLRERY